MEITCRICKQDKSSSEFWAQPLNVLGYETACKQCRLNRRYEQNRERKIEQGLRTKFPTLASRQLAAEGMKYCPGCKQVKDLDEFSTMNVRNGVASHCLECTNRYSKEYAATPEGKKVKHQYYVKNREKAIDQKLRKKFGLTYNNYKEILEQQKGVCAICERTPEQNKKMLAVDHDHVTGKNRGLLCASCNICIGFIEKNQLDFSKLIQYHRHYHINGQMN